MKKTYTKKQITEAIAYWKGVLRKMNEAWDGLNYTNDDEVMNFMDIAEQRATPILKNNFPTATNQEIADAVKEAFDTGRIIDIMYYDTDQDTGIVTLPDLDSFVDELVDEAGNFIEYVRQH